MSDELTNDNIEEVITDTPQTEAEEVVSEQPLAEEAQEEYNEEATPTESEDDAAQEKSTEEAPETAVAEDKPPSRREQLRIQQLLKKYGPPEQRQQAPLQNRQDALDYGTALDADPDVIQQLEADRQATQQSAFSEGLKRAEFLDWKTSLKIDAPTIEKKHPVLDPSSSEFHPAVADAVNNWYLNMSGYDPSTNTVTNPNVSYAEFVEGFMELVQETAGQKNAQTVKNITKQAATTGLRPDGSSANRMNLNKAPQDMTTEELYAVLGQKPPKKS